MKGKAVKLEQRMFLTFPWMDDEAPVGSAFMTIVENSELNLLPSRLLWEFHDLVVSQRFLLRALQERQSLVQAHVEQQMAIQNVDDADSELAEALAVTKTRAREHYHAEASMTDQIARTCIKSTIVNSWILTEGILNETLTILTCSTPSTHQKNLYRWADLVKHFRKHNITLSSIVGYENANFCRILNNCIKHSGKISKDLAADPQFSNDIGNNIRQIDFNPQPYITGTFSSSIGLIEAADAELKGNPQN